MLIGNPSGTAVESAIDEILWEDDGRVYCRMRTQDANGGYNDYLSIIPAAGRLTPETINRLTHEYELRELLDSTWAIRPLELVRRQGQTALILEYPSGRPLHRLIGRPMDVGHFLVIATSLAAAIRKLHAKGLVHKDIKPSNILVEDATQHVRLTGFGIAMRHSRASDTRLAPDFISGTLQYMAPEQTGRMDRSIDFRTDLYSVGVTLYQCITGMLPFQASDPMELLHSHIARMPTQPHNIHEHVPLPISNIIMRLLAKSPQDRYQTAFGLESDLRHCLADWSRFRKIGDFDIGGSDFGDRLPMPKKIYGREAEAAMLFEAAQRVMTTGTSEFVLISGYAGIGKSALVYALQTALASTNCLFAAGKFDQYQRDVPYAPFAMAFQHLTQELLATSDAALRVWREGLTAALGDNGQLMASLIPQLTSIIGEQPPPSRVEPSDAQARFHGVFHDMLGAFARRDHPLVLFIDDVQWLDIATLDLLRFIATHAEIRHLLVICAYRDSDVDAAHPLADTISALRTELPTLSEITLTPLPPDVVAHLAADSLHTSADAVQELAALVSEKTGGNPFFTVQFLAQLAEDGLVAFDPALMVWRWDLERIRSKDISDNIADLMAAKLNRLSGDTREVLGQIACMGNAVDIRTLMAVRSVSREALDVTLAAAIEAGLVLCVGRSLSLIHDRVQEAAYAAIPPSERATTHLNIARAILSVTHQTELEERIFDIVDQFNRGRDDLRLPDERIMVAELNLQAARRAQTASAYSSARIYIDHGLDLLPHGRWSSHYELTFNLERYRAECEFVTGDLSAARTRLATLKTYASTLVHETDIVCFELLVYFTAAQHEAAIELGLAFLERIGNPLPPDADDAAVKDEYTRMTERLDGRSVADLVELPTMTAPDHLATMQVLTELFPAATTGVNRSRALSDLIVMRMANLSLEYGNCDTSCVAYSALSLFLGPRFDDYLLAYRFGLLSCQLADRHGIGRSTARVYSQSGSFALPWFRSFDECRSLLTRAISAGTSTGDTAFAAYTLRNYLTNMLVSGEPLSELQRESSEALNFVRAAGFDSLAERFVGHRWLASALRGLETNSSLQDDGWAHDNVDGQRGAAQMASYHWTFVLHERYFAEDYSAAIRAVGMIEPIKWAMLAGLELLIYHFYAALSHAAMCDICHAGEREEHLNGIRHHARRLSRWSDDCPDNFASFNSLALAELARAEGRVVDAEHLYEVAIQTASRHGFVQNEGLSCELAGRFYRSRGLERIALAYIRDAKACYVRWGAIGKVRDLDRAFPAVSGENHASVSAQATVTHVDHLDLATVIKVSEALSGEIATSRLITTLMRLAIEQAGADRGLLIMPSDGKYCIEAEAFIEISGINVAIRKSEMTTSQLPIGLFETVVDTAFPILLNDTSIQSTFSSDPYIVQRRPQSVLCMPLMRQSILIGVLYLENKLSSHVFTPERISVLKLLASSAAISLENTRLYDELREREAKVRRLVDSNIIGIFIWNSEGDIVEANEAFLRIIGYNRSDFSSGQVRWRDITPAEWLAADEERNISLTETGVAAPFEKEFFRKDGVRVPVLIGAAIFDGFPTQGVAFVVDLTERNDAEEAARDSERRYHDLKLQLVHANRVATLGQLSASIAHELNQPLTGIMTNAGTCLAMLADASPNVSGAAETARRTIRDARRAADVISRLRSLFAKTEFESEKIDLSEVAREVLDLYSHEFRRTGIHVRSDLPNDLPNIMGDRIQLQQVILNLLQNASDAMASFSDRPRHLSIMVARDAGNVVRLSVSDSGTGFDLASQDKLFDAFYTTKSTGMGIGLSVSRSIIESHSGRIWAEANTGPGATFSFSIQGCGLEHTATS